MKDLEICKRIAEIEGFNQVEIRGEVFVSKGFACDTLYNPLTNYELCLELAARHKVFTCNGAEFKKGFKGANPIFISRLKVDGSVFEGCDESPNKAICLAIIEAHKEQ